MNVVVDALMGNVRTLSGPVVPSRLRARLWIHAEPAQGYLLVMAVRRKPGTATWDGVWVKVVRPGEEACLDRERLSGVEVDMPRWRRETKSSICLLVPA